MARHALLALTMGVVLGGVPASAFAQAVAESALTHAGSALSTNLASKLGGRIQQSMSNSQGKLSQGGRRRAQTRTRRGRARTSSPAAGASISISSVQGGGGAAPCPPVNPKAASAQGHAATGSSRTDCLSKSPAPPAVSEITVSF